MLLELHNLDRMFVYQYTFLDDLSSIRNPYEHFSNEPKHIVDNLITKIGELFERNGWEGDGDIGLIWLPPFVDCGIEDTWGMYVWHVKQENNGISFLASEYPLEFERIKEQNEFSNIDDEQKGVPVNIIHSCVEVFTNQIATERKKLQEMLSHIEKSTGEEVVEEIAKNIRTFSQNIIIRNLHEFLDECYLQFLVEVIDSGNPSNIKLRKSQVYLSPSQYIPKDAIEEENQFEGGRWFTLKGIISDMWRAYKYEPFKNKIDMLFKSIEFSWDPKKVQEITKHVILRNCIQHHEGVLHKDVLKQLGLNKVIMIDNDGQYEIEVWKQIYFSDKELYLLCDLLMDFCQTFNAFVNDNIRTRHYLFTKRKDD